MHRWWQCSLWWLMLVATSLAAEPAALYRCAGEQGAVLTGQPGPGCRQVAQWSPGSNPAEGQAVAANHPARVEFPVASGGAPAMTAVGRAAPVVTRRLFPTAYAEVIRAHANRWGIEEAVVKAVIHTESTFNPAAVSPKGAMGLMQLMPATARRFGVRSAFDPGENIRAGVQYLAWLLRRYGGDWRLALAGYNAGEGAVDRYRGVPPFPETRSYVDKVWRLSQSYRVAAGP